MKKPLISRALRDKIAICSLILVISLFGLGLVWLNAHATKLQYEINHLKNDIQQQLWIARDIKAKIASESNIVKIEQRALALGMIYPSEIKYLNGSTPLINDLALLLKENYHATKSR